ncbi:hypothetical protein V6N12_038494 [Hibiscus sabdariffa]|uniref:Uncharacterized protein n=1 Tax=Hibiscus sabdariffa TaxID=183260 RepID=A0ABR2BHN9_9ROSI
MEETKVFQTSLTNFLCFQYLKAATFFTAQPNMTHQVNLSAATQPKSTAKPSNETGNTKQVHFSSDDENDIFDSQTPMEHHVQPIAIDIEKSSHAQKRKAPALLKERLSQLNIHHQRSLPPTSTLPDAEGKLWQAES